MKKSMIAGAVAGVLVLILLMKVFYTVDETEQVVKLQFGRPIGDAITTPGLHFKLPWQDVRRFDKRVLEWDGDENQIPTSDKKFIILDTFARWRIADPLKYLETVQGDEFAAQSRLDALIESATRNFVSQNLLIEAVRNSNRTFEITTEREESSFEADESEIEIFLGRQKITKLILADAAKAMPAFGIELLDVRIKRINYIEEVRRKVYDRMISERKRIADKFRSEGLGKKAEIDGEREKEFQRITSEAYRTTQEIKGKADAEATRIYASSFGNDPDFYSFLQTLESYKSTIGSNTTLILNTNSDYFKYFKSIRR